jgi:hypothetical protein
MSANQSPTTLNQDRIKLPLEFDASKMLNELEALKLGGFAYYNVIPLRAPAHLVDTSLPLPPPASNYADGSWTEWSNTKELEQSPYLLDIVNTFAEHTKVTLVRLLRLAPQSVVQEHTDPTLGLEEEESVVRLTIPIATNEEVKFFLNQVPVDMGVGECWYLRLTDPHKVINNGTTERVNMTLDMVPNEWLRELISKQG